MNKKSVLLTSDKIHVGARFSNKTEAILAVGEMLVTSGHVERDYVPAMLAREKIASTFIGNGVAIPHGTRDALRCVRSPGIAIIQVPTGVDFGDGNIAKLIIGLAARETDHLDLLTNIAEVCSDFDSLEAVISATSPDEILKIFGASLSS